MSATVSFPEVSPDRAAPQATEAVKRNIAVDAYRGLVMLLMMGEVLSFAAVSTPILEACSGACWPTTRPMSNGPAWGCMT